MPQIKLLAIDDDETMLDILRIIFEMHKDIVPQYELFTDIDQFLAAVTPDVHICLIDYFLKKGNGLELIKRVLKTNPYCWFIMVSGQKDLRVIIEFMNNTSGSKYIEKGTLDFSEKLIYHIKDIVGRATAIESIFYESYRNKEALKEVNKSLTNLKESL